MQNTSINENITRYSPSHTVGLSDGIVADRHENGLTNSVKKKHSKSYLKIILDNVCTIFNLLGLIVFVALLCIGDKTKIGDFFFVFFYLANISIGILQEVRAKRCIERLALLTTKNSLVVRDGKLTEINTCDIVLDDIVKLGIGNQIPTDCKIVDGEIEVNEALLTGESVPVKKSCGDSLLAGSFVVSGTCYAQAVKVGKDNYVETLSAKAKQYKKPHSEIMSSLNTIIKVIFCIIVPITVIWLIKTTTLTGDIRQAIYMTSTPVIGMIPAGMFLLTSVALALGIIKLSRHNTLIQDLYSLEMLARVDTICFDKTGTITDGKMTVISVEQIAEHENSVEQIMSSMLNSLGDNNQTAIALFNHFGQQSYFKHKTVLPFSSARKLSAVTFENIGTYAFGAPEFVLREEKFKEIESKINYYAKQGLRVIVLAHSEKEIINDEIPNNFNTLSLIVIADNIREEAVTTVEWFKQNDVDIKVISGDNPITVSEVSKRVGINNAEKYISLEGVADEQIYEIANKYTIFGRVSPEQKAILVKALKQAGHVTAMTGDGVNDILALKESDCAITVASGSDATRSVSHIVLLDNNFNSMPQVVHEGRRVINNVQASSSLFLMKTLFTMLMAIITLVLPYMKSYPYTLSNMFMFEVFIIGIPSFFLSLQPNDQRVKGNFITYIIKHTIPSALIMILSIIIIEFCRVNINYYPPELKIYETMGIIAITYAGAINLYNICKPLNKFRALIIIPCLLLVVLVTVISTTTSLGSLFSLSQMTPLNLYWHHVLIVLAIILINLPLRIVLHKLFSKINIKTKKV